MWPQHEGVKKQSSLFSQIMVAKRKGATWRQSITKWLTVHLKAKYNKVIDSPQNSSHTDHSSHHKIASNEAICQCSNMDVQMRKTSSPHAKYKTTLIPQNWIEQGLDKGMFQHNSRDQGYKQPQLKYLDFTCRICAKYSRPNCQSLGSMDMYLY